MKELNLKIALEEEIKRFFEDYGYEVRQIAIDDFSDSDWIDFAGRLNFRVKKRKDLEI